MKSLIILVTLLIFSPLSRAQDSLNEVCNAALAKKMESDFYFVTTYPKDKCITIKGELGDQIVAALYADANKKRRRTNYHANIRNFNISGLVNNMRVTIIEGIHSYEPEKSRSTFHVFDNEQNKQERLNNLKENQKRGYSIHFRHASFLRSSKDAVTEKLEAYLMGLIN
ncbi:MAG: hypothetical protein GQ574_00675 [Crocinitomix sp.]|nr:hypothetical protein [Crocinitomix sp.]